jgi:hypothetical protein
MKDPAKHGWSPEKLNAALDFAKASGSSVVMVIENGVVVGETGNTAQKISSYSIRKSLISALYGIYAAEGVIDINQSLEQLGIDDYAPSLSHEEKQARIVDLLRARSGVYHPVDFETQYMISAPAGQPSSWNLLVLQQLGLQRSWNNPGTENRTVDRGSVLPPHCKTYRNAGFQAGRCLLHGRSDLKASRLPFRDFGSRHGAFRLALSAQGPVGEQADRAGSVGSEKFSGRRDDPMARHRCWRLREPVAA